jgi:hypothetical protein
MIINKKFILGVLMVSGVTMPFVERGDDYGRDAAYLTKSRMMYGWK